MEKKKKYYAITTSMTFEKTVLVPIEEVVDLDSAISIVDDAVTDCTIALLHGEDAECSTIPSPYANEHSIMELSESEASAYQILDGNANGFLLDCGVLLSKDHEEFDSYCAIYNNEYGFFDESQCYFKTFESALAEAKAYVENGVEYTYAVISSAFLPDAFDFVNGCVEDADYDMEHVVYSVAKIGGVVVEHFLGE